MIDDIINFDLRDCCRAVRASLDVEHRGIELDGRALHVAMKHAMSSVEENAWPDARRRPDEKNDGAVPCAYRWHVDSVHVTVAYED